MAFPCTLCCIGGEHFRKYHVHRGFDWDGNILLTVTW